MRKMMMVSLIVTAVLAAAGASHARDLTVVGWGGASQKAQRAAYFEPYMKVTGNSLIEAEYNGEMAKIKAMVESNNVTWDVVEVEALELVRGCEEGLFMPLEWDNIGSPEDYISFAVSECGVGTFVWSTVLAYNADKLETGPTSWADFWDLEKFPGKRGLRKGAKFTLEFALLADGVLPDDVYKVLITPEGVDRAFKKLDEIKPHIQWWETGAQPPQWLAAGDVVMSSAYNGRISAAQAEGQNLKIAWDGMVFTLDYWAIVSGSPNAEQAYEFLKIAGQPENQLAYSRVIPYGPTNKQAVGELGPELMSNSPTAPDHLARGVFSSTEFWVEYGEALEERFNVWAAQ